MTSQFNTAAGKSLLDEITALFETGRVFRRNDVPFVFVCGGPTNQNTMRKQFLDWSNRELPQVVTVLAERAFRDTLFHDPPQTYNLGVFESLIAEISDCVILFPESPGAYAEMGLFSTSRVGKKILVVNDLRYQAVDSFVNLGPISTINRRSFLNPALHLQSDHPAGIDFSPIRERLERIMARKKRKSFVHRPYRELTWLEKSLIVMEMINLVHVVSVVGLLQCIGAAFGTAKGGEIKKLLSILVGANSVERIDGDFYILAKDAKSGLEFEGSDVGDIKARVLHYYRKQVPFYYDLVARAET